MQSGLTVIEQQAVHEAVHECILQSGWCHTFMKAHLRISVKGFVRNKNLNKNLKIHRRYMAC